MEWSKRKPEPKVDEDQLSKIEKEAESLLKLVNEADEIPGELRTLLTTLLSSIIEAVKHHRVRGFPPLEKAVAQIVGEYELNRKVTAVEVKDKGAKELLKRVALVISMFVSTVSFAEKGWKALETVDTVTKFLTSGEPVIPKIEIPGQPTEGESIDK